MKVLENTPAVLSLGKVCDEHGCSYEWINGQKPHLIKNGIRIQCTETFVPTSCLFLVLAALSINITPTFQVDLPPLQRCSSLSPTPSPTHIGDFFHISTVTVITAPFPFHACARASITIAKLTSLRPSPGTALEFPFFFSRKRKVGPMSRACGSCGSE